MSLLIRRKPDGTLEGCCLEEPRWQLINSGVFPVSGMPIRVAQFVDIPGAQSIWAMDSLTLNLWGMLDEQPLLNGGRFVDARDHVQDDDDEEYANDDNDSHRLFHPFPHFLYARDIFSPSSIRIYHCDAHGMGYGGSNCYIDGSLCLGESYDPLTLGPVDLLMNSHANDDLSWVGGEITYELRPSFTDPSTTIPIITEWPTLSTRVLHMPPGISGFFDRLSPT